MLMLAMALTACVKLAAGTFEEMVPMPDGTKLYTYGMRPEEGVKCAIVIKRNPYVKEERVDLAAFEKSQSANFARGYAYLVQHCRGCGMSEGDWIPYESERIDGLALLEWVRKLPWYNGEIFLEGSSYLATVHWAYLGTNPPDVKGAALSVQEVDRYNIIYRNGFYKTGLHGNWFLKGYKKKNHELKRDKSVSLCDFPLCDFSRRYWGATDPAFDNPLAHPRSDDSYWASREPGSGAEYRDALKKSSMPILLRTSFYDIYTEGLCEMWRETPKERLANCALLIDAYDHGGRLAKDMKGTLGEFPCGARLDEGVSAVDWFDYCRTGRPCKNAAPGKVRYYALWENRWVEASSLDDGQIRSDFTLGDGEMAWTYDPKRPLPEFPGSGGICFGGMRPQPPPSFRDDVVSFVLPPIESRLDVRGRMRASLVVKSDCEDTCVYARVSVKKPDGVWYLLRDDITSLSANGGDYEPGTWRRVELRFADHAFRLEKGDVLRIDVASASSQFAPHGNVRGLQSAVREPKVAHNAVDAKASRLVLFGCAQSESGDGRDGFVSLAEAVPDAILEIRYYSTYNFVGDRIDGYERPVALITKEAATALRAASDECVRRGYRLKIYDAYRPQRAVCHFMRWAKDANDTRMKAPFYPNLDKSVLFAQGYIAEKSGHSRGSTVDLTLFDMTTGKEVDMGGTFDWFGRESHPEYKGITEVQFANRMLLRKIMVANGFKPIAEEWWHFTYENEPYPDTYFDFPVR